MSIIAFLFSAVQPHEARIEVRRAWVSDCLVRRDGMPIPFDQLELIARTWPNKNKLVLIDGGVDVPYKCIGGVIYALQVVGFKNIRFIAAPPSTETGESK